MKTFSTSSTNFSRRKESHMNKENKKEFNQIAYQNEYIGKKYDRINLITEKGKKAAIKAHAEGCGESVNAFINRAIDEQIARDGEM